MGKRLRQSGADPIETRPGFAALLDRIEANGGVRTVIVEDASQTSARRRRHDAEVRASLAEVGTGVMKKYAIIIGAGLAMSHPALAQKTVTCTGTLIDVWLKPKGEWPLAVIYDAAGGYTCTLDRTGAGHDPLRPCSAGEKCRVTGTYRTLGIGEPKTYSIQTITDLSDLHEPR